jgi:hypothetical protein
MCLKSGWIFEWEVAAFEGRSYASFATPRISRGFGPNMYFPTDGAQTELDDENGTVRGEGLWPDVKKSSWKCRVQIRQQEGNFLDVIANVNTPNGS